MRGWLCYTLFFLSFIAGGILGEDPKERVVDADEAPAAWAQAAEGPRERASPVAAQPVSAPTDEAAPPVRTAAGRAEGEHASRF